MRVGFQRFSLCALLVIMVSVSSACTDQLAIMGIRSPNHRHDDTDFLEMSDGVVKKLGADRQMRVEVGPPEASLRLLIMDPKGEHQTPRGTIIVIHGIRVDSMSMLGNACEFAHAGWRAVLVDLRGHGGSTGQWLTYGVRESSDITQVITALEKAGELQGPLGVYGISYGGTTSIHSTARDPRIQACVAVAPFSNMREEVEDFGRNMSPLFLGHLLSDEGYDNVVARMGEIAQFNTKAADARLAIAQTNTPILLVHGKDDIVVPYYHSEQLHAANPDTTEILTLPDDGHVSAWMDLNQVVMQASLAWFTKHLDPDGAVHDQITEYECTEDGNLRCMPLRMKVTLTQE